MSVHRRAGGPLFTVGLILALSAVMRPQPLGAEWYVSDANGIIRAEISEAERGDHEYVMHVEETGSTEVQTLYHEGEQVARTELEYADGKLIARRYFRDGQSFATEHFAYWGDGSLRSVRRVNQRGAIIEYRYSNGRLREEWVTRGDSGEVVRYDESGRVIERTVREDGEVVEHETREYWGDLATDRLRRVVVIADGVETVYRYDEEGRLLGSSRTREGTVESDRTRIFEDGLLVEEREEVDGVLP